MLYDSQIQPIKHENNKTGVINDPLGQTHSLAIVFALFCFARFWKVGTDGLTDVWSF